LKALIIDDMRRRGGGQTRAKVTASALNDLGYDTYFLTNVDSVDGVASGVAYRVEYEFRENSPRITDFIKILRLRNQLRRIDISGFDVSINNHPNVFIINGNVNVLHGFSFLDPWLDEKGELSSRLPPAIFRLTGLYDIYNGSFFIPNSKYTRDISLELFKELGLSVELGDVIYHPVTVKKVDLDEKKEQVLLLGRISKHKGIEEVARIANENSIRIIVAGYVNRGDEGFVKKLRREAGKNVEILENVSEGEKERLMIESSTILNMNRKEHFGFAVVEAMSYGCVPVVPKSGGHWTDIVEFGKYGLGYDGQDELAAMLEKSFSYSVGERLRIVESLKRFSFEEFRRKIADVIEKVNSTRK